MQKSNTLNKQMIEYKNNFYKVYQNSVIPVFRQFEKERKEKLAFITGLCSLLGLMIIITVSSLVTGNIPRPYELTVFIVITVIVLSTLAIILVPFYMNKKFVNKLKYSCMNSLLSMFGNIQWYNETDLITDGQLSLSNLFGEYNRRTSFDSFSGEFHGVKFQICETEMSKVTGSGKNKTTVSIFKGVIVKFKANKDIKSNTIIATKGDKKIKNRNCTTLVSLVGLFQFVPHLFDNGFSLGGLILFILFIILVFGVAAVINYFARKSEKIQWQEIKLEDPEFTKKYKAYSENQIEARYLITPAFMERFQNIQTAFGTNKAKCSFYGDSLMFAISTNKNLFEIGNLWHSLENPKQMENFFNELTSIFMLVDYFKLNEKIGL